VVMDDRKPNPSRRAGGTPRPGRSSSCGSGSDETNRVHRFRSDPEAASLNPARPAVEVKACPMQRRWGRRETTRASGCTPNKR